MVNEINRPPPSVIENAHLEERLASSNRHLQQMQEEHRQLVQEMETLRERAEVLGRLNAQRQHLQEEISNDSDGDVDNESTTSDDEYLEFSENSSLENHSTETAQLKDDICTETDNQVTSSSSTTEVHRDNGQGVAPVATTSPTTKTEPETEEESTESAEYIQQKLAEVAALKAQLRRVQNMMNTTNLIEQHIAGKETSEANAESTQVSQIPNQIPKADVTAQSSPLLEQPSGDLRNSSENDLLLSAMMNMFTEFTSDLREQADNLRAERERIRALKEDLIRRKNQSS